MDIQIQVVHITGIGGVATKGTGGRTPTPNKKYLGILEIGSSIRNCFHPEYSDEICFVIEVNCYRLLAMELYECSCAPQTSLNEFRLIF